MRKARIAAGYSQKSAASELQVSIPTISDWEAGKINPTVANLKKMAVLYHVSIGYLLGCDDKELVVGNPQPVSLLCHIYCLNSSDLLKICNNKLDPDLPIGLWVDGYFCLEYRHHGLYEMYPKGEMLKALSDFFEIPEQSLAIGEGINISVKQTVLAKIQKIRDSRPSNSETGDITDDIVSEVIAVQKEPVLTDTK